MKSAMKGNLLLEEAMTRIENKLVSCPKCDSSEVKVLDCEDFFLCACTKCSWVWIIVVLDDDEEEVELRMRASITDEQAGRIEEIELGVRGEPIGLEMPTL